MLYSVLRMDDLVLLIKLGNYLGGTKHFSAKK